MSSGEALWEQRRRPGAAKLVFSTSIKLVIGGTLITGESEQRWHIIPELLGTQLSLPIAKLLPLGRQILGILELPAKQKRSKLD